MGGRGGAPRTNLDTAIAQAAARAEAPAAAPQSLERQILNSYQSLTTRPGELVSLVRLRNALSGIDRATLDAELKRLDRARIIQLDPDPNQKALPPEAHRDAIRLGGEPKHFISAG
jgi:hypothetical protein